MSVEEFNLAGFPGLLARGEGRQRPAPLLFLHAAWEDHRQFAAHLPLFASAGWDAYAVSRRGRRGVPPAGARGVRFADYLADTLRAIAALPEPPVVIGHSLGALLAQKVAEAGRCRAAVLLAPVTPAGIWGLPGRAGLPVFLKLAPVAVSGWPYLVSQADADRVWLNGVPPAERPRITARWTPESGLVLRQVLLGVRLDRRRVRCPVLVFTGTEDRSVPAAWGRRLARAYRAELHEEPGRGHWLTDEPGCEARARTIMDWLDATVPDGS